MDDLSAEHERANCGRQVRIRDRRNFGFYMSALIGWELSKYLADQFARLAMADCELHQTAKRLAF